MGVWMCRPYTDRNMMHMACKGVEEESNDRILDWLTVMSSSRVSIART
jgi:hypothetical protein